MVRFNIDKFTKYHKMKRVVYSTHFFYDITDYIFNLKVSENWANRKAQKEYARHFGYTGKLKFVKNGKLFLIWFLIPKMVFENDFDVLDKVNEENDQSVKNITYLTKDEIDKNSWSEKLLEFSKKFFDMF